MLPDAAFPRVFANISPLGNEVPTYKFAYTDERSWQARYDYDFAALGVPGLTSTVRYITGNNVRTWVDFLKAELPKLFAEHDAVMSDPRHWA